MFEDPKSIKKISPLPDIFMKKQEYLSFFIRFSTTFIFRVEHYLTCSEAIGVIWSTENPSYKTYADFTSKHRLFSSARELSFIERKPTVQNLKYLIKNPKWPQSRICAVSSLEILKAISPNIWIQSNQIKQKKCFKGPTHSTDIYISHV